MLEYTHALLNQYEALGVIGIDYAIGRITRQQYIEAAMALGLSEECAKARALTYDLVPLASCT